MVDLTQTLLLSDCTQTHMQQSVPSRGALIIGRNQYRPIINQFAHNRYRPFDDRHWPTIGRLFVLVSKTTKNAFNCSSH